jgi:hypothetical protein
MEQDFVINIHKSNRTIKIIAIKILVNLIAIKILDLAECVGHSER